jgi:hypothetical protein
MFCIDKVITRVKISVVFDDGNIPAAWTKDTQRVLLPKGRSSSLLKDLYFDLADVLAHPLIENSAQEITERFGRHGATADAALGIGLRLNQGQKSHVLGVELPKEPVYLQGIPDIVRVHHTEYLA